MRKERGEMIKRICFAVCMLLMVSSADAVTVCLADSVGNDTLKTKLNVFHTPIPDYMLDEVVITARRLDRVGIDYKMSSVDAQLLAQHPAGFNPLALIAWGVSKIVGERHKMTRRERFKKIIENY